MRDAGQDGTLKKRIKRDRTRRDKKVRDAGQDGMNFWLSRGVLMYTAGRKFRNFYFSRIITDRNLI